MVVLFKQGLVALIVERVFKDEYKAATLQAKRKTNYALATQNYRGTETAQHGE